MCVHAHTHTPCYRVLTGVIVSTWYWEKWELCWLTWQVRQFVLLQTGHLNSLTLSSKMHQPRQSGVLQWNAFPILFSAWATDFAKCCSYTSAGTSCKIIELLTKRIIFNVLHPPPATSNAVKYIKIKCDTLYLMYEIQFKGNLNEQVFNYQDKLNISVPNSQFHILL